MLRNRLIAAHSAIQDTLHRLQQSYVQEAHGTGGSGKRGIDKLTRLKMEAYQQMLSQSGPELSRLAEQISVQDSVLAGVRSATEIKRTSYAANYRRRSVISNALRPSLI